MMSLALVKPSLQELREMVGAVQNLEKETRSFSLFKEGFPKGTLVALSGQGKTELICQFLREHPELKTIWIEREVTVNPYGLFQRGVKTENILFIEAGENIHWCLTQALQSGCFQVLVTGDVDCDEREMRRYQLLSERCDAHFFMLSEEPQQSWAPHLQLQVTKKKIGFNIEVLKRRGTGTW